MAEPIAIITADDLIAYPGAGNPTRAHANVYVRLVNGLITEAWTNPEDPIPFWVTTIALESAARAARNPKGLASWTRSLDDGSRTERVSNADAARAGVYLSAADVRRLRGLKSRKSRFGTIRVDIGY